MFGIARNLKVSTWPLKADTKTGTASTNATPTPSQPPKPVNPAAVKKAVALGKEVRKQPSTTASTRRVVESRSTRVQHKR